MHYKHSTHKHLTILMLTFFMFALTATSNSQPTNRRGTYPKLETAFTLPNFAGDPFDYERIRVQVRLRTPKNGTVNVPAFSDGGTTWRMRFTPTSPGKYTINAILINGQMTTANITGQQAWVVTGRPQAGFLRVDPTNANRFLFDNGTRYFPLGHNQGWQSTNLPDIPTLFGKMQAAGENWSRVWMNHWDNKNLDWTSGGKPERLGALDLNVARKWDAIVEAAGRHGIYFQLVLQHHGQYSTTTNPNWSDNPYNIKNGGFLQNPKEFFTNAQARALTKRKLYYTLARWGYSPHILAFELFNEVQFTDAGRGKQWDAVAAWHREMAQFIRQHDFYRHLITTSATPDVPINSTVWETMDYYQRHTYPPDLVTTLGGADPSQTRPLTKPYFVGEFGPQNLQDTQGIHLHAGLWASLLSGASGAGQYWDWEPIERHNLYHHFRGARAFIEQAKLAERQNLMKLTVAVPSSRRTALRFGPGGGWGEAKQSEFTVGPDTFPPGIEAYPSFLQGQSHRNMTPKPLTFRVNFVQPGAFVVTVGQVAKAGAHLKMSVDGQLAERDFPSAPNDYTPKDGQETLQIAVPAGAHMISIENTGQDWVVIRYITLPDYASALAANVLASRDFAIAWVYHRDNLQASPGQETPATSGTITLPRLAIGPYRALWSDTLTGQVIREDRLVVRPSPTDRKSGQALILTPLILRDATLIVSKS